MARKDKPYLPLYVQDFMTDEKLMECSAKATGVYIKIMCVLHKSETYGKVLLRQKDQQNKHQINNFAARFAKHLPFDLETIISSLVELTDEGCLIIEGNSLYQKRMFNDGNLSVTRSLTGSLGGKITKEKLTNFATAKVAANADTDNDICISNKEEEKKEIILEKFWFLKFYHSDYENYKRIFNGQSTTENYFTLWKQFIDFIYLKKYEELFECKFLNPHDFAKLVQNENFTKENWDAPLKKILATGIEPKHNLFFRIPEFIKYSKGKEPEKPENVKIKLK